jgi:hypothetical protein
MLNRGGVAIGSPLLATGLSLAPRVAAGDSGSISLFSSLSVRTQAYFLVWNLGRLPVYFLYARQRPRLA